MCKHHFFVCNACIDCNSIENIRRELSQKINIMPLKDAIFKNIIAIYEL